MQPCVEQVRRTRVARLAVSAIECRECRSAGVQNGAQRGKLEKAAAGCSIVHLLSLESAGELSVKCAETQKCRCALFDIASSGGRACKSKAFFSDWLCCCLSVR